MIDKHDMVKTIEAARAKGFLVYGPTRQDGLALLAEIADPNAIVFDHVLTVNTLKDVLLPRCERLARLDLEGGSVVAAKDQDRPILVFGSRPCDAAGVAILDAILLGQVRDARYGERRSQTTIMTIACSKCDDACFCTSMGYGPHDPTGSDVLLVPDGDRYSVRALSDKGRTLLRALGLSEDAGGGSAPPSLSRKLETGGLKAWLDANFDHQVWRDISENCAGCGTCYYLCPTCHCFDIADEAGIARGERLRIWDCCSFSDFTKMAAHQPRRGRHARYRQRVMHKFAYCPDNVGKVACVGDGRCIRHCPYGVDICEAISKLVSAK
ncbi:MAG TPA: 4Fe-4S dicluster domain-containing protein [bacterium]|nr:4Fe-4S dicluster domain-containing protein [bacterium]